ncbi:MAG: serine/threonine protein kinase [Planctomycetota bacterium]
MAEARDPLPLPADDDVSDEVFARAAVQKDLADLGAMRECLGVLRDEPPDRRRPLSAVMIQEGVIGRQDVEAIAAAVRTGAVRDKRIARYELLGMIGEGGMGAVYAAVDVDTLEFCALKILPKELAEDADIVKRFLQEAETACTLRHPNIVGGLRVGEDLGLHFFSMEFVDGVTVYDRLEDEGVLPEGESLRIVRGACLGLQYASEKGLVHRDIKPENIMIDRDGTPKLLDMGLVKRLDAGHATRLTQTGMAIGTPHYISPEQARGDEEVDSRSDIYALGATLYHMVTGQVPFEGSTAAVIMTKHLSEELDYPSDINPAVSEHTSRLVSKMMAKAPHNRYGRPKDVVADIDLIVTGKAPSGELLPPGASSIRQAVQIERVKRRAKRAGVTSVHARIEKRERGGLPELLGRYRKPLIYAAGVLVALNVIFFVLLLATRRDPATDPAHPDEASVPAAAAGAGAEPVSPVDELIGRLRKTEVEKLPEVFDALPDVAALPPEDAQRLAAAVQEAAAVFDAEAERRLEEALLRAKPDPASRKAVVAELRKLRVTFEQSLAVTQIDEAIARLTPRPPPPKVKPPKAEPVDLAALKGIRGWRTYGNWAVEKGALVFTYNPGKKYDRAAQSVYGFGEGRVTAEIKTVGGTRAEIAVWDQATSDRKHGAPGSVGAALAKGQDLSPAQRLFAPLEITADPRNFSVKLAGRKLPTHIEGPLRSGRVRFSFTGGKWWIRNLKISPPASGGRPAYAVNFMDAGHGWSGGKSEKGLAAAPGRSRKEAWLTTKAGPGGGTLFTVADGMRMRFVFRAERVQELFARMESAKGRRWEFRLSGRPVEERWSELAIRLKDFRTDRGGTPVAGDRVKTISIGASGQNPILVLTSLRVVK